MRMKSKGFTLVELLVVIGIIAVLISILLPALNAARAQAQVVNCASQLRQVGIATHVYAANNKGAIPPPRFDSGSLSYNYSYNFSQNNGWPYGTDDLGSNIGRLQKLKILGEGEQITRCPSGPQTSAEDPRYYDANYHYNVHIKYVSNPPGSATYSLQVWWKKISGFGKVPADPMQMMTGNGATTGVLSQARKALASDPLGSIFSDRFVTHLRRGQKIYNLLYIDGSVQSASVDAKINRGQVNSWARYLDLLEYMEAVNAGVEVQRPPVWNTYGAPINP